MSKFENTLAFARQMDEADPLKAFRDKFYIPIVNGRECIYFAGNSLGLQPKTAQENILNDLEDWANFGVEGHFHARIPWVKYHEIFPPKLAPILGAKEEEIVVMSELTVNLHLLLISFYKPTKERYKIICEAKAFPSDQYALQSQALLHGLDPEKTIIEVKPREGEHTIRNEDIISAIKKHADKVAVVIIGGINYYSGQVFDMKSITAAAHDAGAPCGFDLAHAAGNVELHLHDWDVDFACWCSYKYLNSGPGSVAGAFIHERYIRDKSMVRLAGWVGTNKDRRFMMEKEFDPVPTAEGWQLSTTQVLNMSAHAAALDIFEEAGFENIVSKMKKLSSYLMFVLDDINESSSKKIIEIITPRNENEHGCQVSVLLHEKGKQVFDSLKQQGVIVDWREPNVIRVAPAPLYNTFEEIFAAAQIIKNIISP
ncbi:MAG TPA: kynureninase [Chitinophagaceae bacterium]|nr:kynureninase [Chitinophagaceae bacterium]